jgi:hypothetical protein
MLRSLRFFNRISLGRYFMPGKATKQQKPEDMLLRVIRVAEILAKGLDQKSGTGHMDIRDVRIQKTQM